MKKLYLVAILVLILIACNTNLFPLTQNFNGPNIDLTSIINISNSSTCTPFQPLPPTSTSTVTPTPVDTNTPTLTPTYFTPTAKLWNNNLIAPNDQVNILVLGSDWRPGAGYRTDIIILISINPKDHIISAVSFPRDLYVSIPGHEMNRINVAHALGGFSLLSDTFYENFNIRPDHYVMTNLNGFKNIIDSMGGIEVNAARQLTDKCDLPQSNNGYCSVLPGIIYMDGATALWYVRSRYTTSDFDRMRRSQEVMSAIFYKMLSLDVILKAPTFYNLFINNINTDLNSDTIFSLITILPNITIRKFIIGTSETTPYRVPENGAQVLIPDHIAIQNILKQALYLY